MSDTSVIDYGKSKIKAAKFIGEVDGNVAAADVSVAATGEVSAGTLQDVIAALDVRIKSLEDAA